MQALNPASAGFSSEEQQAWNNLVQEVGPHAIRLVSINHLQNYLNGDVLNFNLADLPDTLRPRGIFLQSSGDTTYTWWGELPDAEGYVGITANNTGKLIVVSTPTQRYMLHPLSSRYNAQVTLAPDTLDKACALEDTETDPPPPGPGCEVDTCKNIINALVLVTPEAISEVVGYHPDPVYAALYFTLGEQTMNYILINSNVVGKTFRFVRETYTEFHFSSNNNIFYDIDSLEVDQNAWNRLAANQADVIILLTNDRYGDYAGIESVQPNMPVAIVSAKHLFGPRFTFAHEIGHMLDARHSRESQGGNIPDNSPGCNTGYRAEAVGAGYVYTVMAVIDAGESRIPYFSNPNINYSGVPIGNAKSYNAAYITETICTVADFFFPTDELRAEIAGPAPNCTQGATYTAALDLPGAGVPGNAPFTYKWYFGAAPYTNPLSGTFIGNSHTVSLNAAAIPYEKYWLYLSVHSSDGVTATTLREFVNPCFAAEEKAALPDGTMRPSTGFVCYPNPASDRVTIAFSEEMNHQGNYHYQIFDALGSLRLSGVFQLSEEAYCQTIPFDLPAGMYTIRLRTGAFNTSKIIIVAH
ncbi:MAG: zinc-dependent metalloprotease [Saprospiraceae bacterium]|nr:zinc-dependent metalloprotease [Saprospiraceae bacterium]